MAKNSRNHSSILAIPTQLSRRLRRFSDRSSQPLIAGKSRKSRECSEPARLAPKSTRDMSSYFRIGSRDLEQRIRFRKRLSFADVG